MWLRGSGWQIFLFRRFGGFVGCSNFDHPEAPCSYARPLHVPGKCLAQVPLCTVRRGCVHVGCV